jgi:vesicle coat complex subunit
LGKTDWKGAISVPPESDGAVRYLIVRNGSIAIKRPVLPGLYPTLSAAVPTDRARVFAEGVATGLRGYVVDVLIQRMTLKHRIEILLEKKQFEKAAELLNKQYLTLPSAREVSIRLSQTEERLLNRKDADVGQRERIKKMFDELEQAVAELISDTKQAEELTSRVLNKDAAPPPKTKEDLLDEMLDQNLDEPADTPPAKVEDFD